MNTLSKWSSSNNIFRSSMQSKDQFIPPYTPVFKDGWVPPHVIAGKDVSNVSATIAANAAAVAQLNEEQRKVCFCLT